MRLAETIFSNFKMPTNSNLSILSGSDQREGKVFGAIAAVGVSAGVYLLVKRRRKGGSEPKNGAKAITPAHNTTPFISPFQAMHLIRGRRSIFPKQYSTETTVPRQVLTDMLEAARWAPSHHVTQPWYFITFETLEQRVKLGHFLANQYKAQTEVPGSSREFSAKRYSKKIANAGKAAFIIAVCVETDTRNPVLEEVCSVACAVQNMHLTATAHRVAAYWSTSSIFVDKDTGSCNSKVMDFLKMDDDHYMCLGWMFVGAYDPAQSWPKSVRGPVSQHVFGETPSASP